MNKHFLIPLLLIAAKFSPSQVNVTCVGRDTVSADSVLVGNKLLHTDYYDYPDNKRAAGMIENGKKEGEWTYWNYNGDQTAHGRYKNGLKEGRWTEPWMNEEDNELLWKNVSFTGEQLDSMVEFSLKNYEPGEDWTFSGSYHNGLREGRWITRYDVKKKFHFVMAVSHFKNGKRTGPYKAWAYFSRKRSKHGQVIYPKRVLAYRKYLRVKGKFKNDLRQGEWMEMKEDGEIKIEETYLDGKLDGKFLSWEGNEISEEKWFRNGKPDGPYELTYWIKKRKGKERVPDYPSERTTGQYTAGKESGYWRSYEYIDHRGSVPVLRDSWGYSYGEDGRVKTITHFTSAAKDTVAGEQYFRNDTLIREKIFKHGLLVTERYHYFTDTLSKMEEEFANGRIVKRSFFKRMKLNSSGVIREACFSYILFDEEGKPKYIQRDKN